jgi:hypothetical protein
MSRTAHHVRPRHRNDGHRARGLPPMASGHVLVDLRYPHAALRDAEPDGRRPGPTRVRVAFVAYEYPRSYNDDTIAWLARQAHRRSRRTARGELAAARQLANAAGRAGPSLAEVDLDDIDVTPPPRRSACWDAW